MFTLHAISVIVVVTILLLNLSYDKEGDSVRDVNPHPHLEHWSEIDTRQQLHSKLPNFNDELRELRWGKLNFLHTTDTHGWYAGHINQPQYSSDWGDYVSFVHHMKSIADAKDVDLLLVDTGDKHDGNGLSDLSVPNGMWSDRVFLYQDYDLITVGNHELYVANVSKLEFETVVPHFGERFVSTNVEYRHDGEWVPFGKTHRFFETKNNGYKIFSLAFLFDFHGGNEDVRVTPIVEVVEQQWFLDLLQSAVEYSPDVIVVFGHLPVSHDWKELQRLHDVLREHFPQTVIQYFGGHSHIRDFAVYDERSTGLQSGRYCETVGFLSLGSLENTHDDSTIQYYLGANDWIESRVSRSYIDFNLHSFMYHANISTLDEFNTDLGLNVSNEIYEIGKTLGLGKIYGYVKKNYYLTGAAYPSDNSLLTLLEREVLTKLVPKVHDEDYSDLHTNNSRIVLINTGSIRYDLYKGEFTENSKYIVSPFQNRWNVITNVPRSVALQIMPLLNNQTYIALQSPYLNAMYDRYVVDTTEENSRACPKQNRQKPFLPDDEQRKVVHWLDYFSWKSTSYGYVTHDDLGADGDDTVHKPLPYYPTPNVIQSYEKPSVVSYLFDFWRDDELVDVVYYDFIEPYVLAALKQIENGEDYEEYVKRIRVYNDYTDEYNLGSLLTQWVQTQ